MRLNNKDLEYLEESFTNYKQKEKFYIEASNNQALFVSGVVFKYDSYDLTKAQNKNLVIEVDIKKFLLNSYNNFFDSYSSKTIGKWFNYFLTKDENIIENIFQEFFNINKDLSEVSKLNYLIKFVLSNKIPLSASVEEKLMLGCDLKNNSFKRTTYIYSNLILRNIENGCSRDTIIKSLKDYLRKNTDLTKNTLELFNSVREKIKDWDLTEYLTCSEIDTFFGKEKGITIEETKGYYYKIDASQLNEELKIKAGTIYNNIRVLFNSIPEILINDKDFLNIVTTAKHPIVIGYLSMSGNTSKDKMDMINELITVISQYPKILPKEDLVDFSRKWFFRERLNKSLETNEGKNAKVNKI